MVVGGGMALTEAARSCVMDLFPAPVSSKKSISFSLCYLSQKLFGHCVGLQGKGSLLTAPTISFFLGLVVLLEEPELAVLQFQWSLAELLQGCVQAEKEQNYA